MMEAGRVRQIVEQCQRGDREAFGQLYTLMHDRLLRVCQRYVPDETTCEDLLHDAFLLIFSKIDSIKDISKAEAWMQKVTQNLALTYLQQRKQKHEVPLDSIKEAAVSVDMGSAETYEKILALIDQLPNSYQRVFRMSVLEGMSHQQIADLLNIDSHTSSAELFRAKKMLRRSLAVLFLGLLAIGVPIGLWKLWRQPDSPSITSVEPQQTVHQGETDSLDTENSQFRVGKLPVYTAQTITSQAITADSTTSLPVETTEQDTTKIQEEIQEKIQEKIQENPQRQILKETNTIAETPDLPAIKAATSNQDWMLALAYSGFNSQQSFNLPYGVKDMNDPVLDTITHHRLPMTIALQVNKMLNSRLSVGTGLQYTQLYSETHIGNTYAWDEQQQRLHYLGIPLRLSWYPVRSNRWSIYGTAQTMLELPLHGTQQKASFVEGLQVKVEDLKLSPSVQWSVGVGVGLEYRLTPVIGIYAEPSLQYFFKTGDGLDTWRTAHSTTFSVPLGVRIMLGSKK